MTYDSTHNVHNWTPETSEAIKASLERAKTGELEEWAAFTDSSSTGAITNAGWLGIGVVFDHLLAWPIIMRNYLDVPVAGTGFVRTLDNTLIDDRWTLPGTGWWKQHKTFAYHTRNGVAPQFFSDKAGDCLTVAYYDGGPSEPCSFTVKVAGVIVRTINSTSVPGWRKVTINVDVPANVPVTFTKKSGAYLAPMGACVWNSDGGLLLHNVGQGGSSAEGTGTANDRWSDNIKRESLGKVYADVRVNSNKPLAVQIISLGGNDKRLKVPDNDFIKALREVVQRQPETATILIGETQLADSLVPRAVWETTLNRQIELAYELGVPLIDQYQRLGPYTQMKADGLLADTAGHLKPVVLADLGRSAAELLVA